MKKMTKKSLLIIIAILFMAGSALATKPGQDVKPNGFPSVEHYNLNIIGKGDQFVWPGSDLVSTFKGLFRGINEILSGIDIWNLLKNPWFIALMGITCIIFVVSGMETALVIFLSIVFLLVLYQKTALDLTLPDCYIDKLPIFVGGLLAIAVLNLYFFLVRK